MESSQNHDHQKNPRRKTTTAQLVGANLPREQHLVQSKVDSCHTLEAVDDEKHHVQDQQLVYKMQMRGEEAGRSSCPCWNMPEAELWMAILDKTDFPGYRSMMRS